MRRGGALVALFVAPCFVSLALRGLGPRPEPRHPVACRAQGPQGGDDLIRFGKYKGQLTLRQVAEKDPRYVAWVRNKLSKEGYAQALLKFVDSSRATPPPPKPFSAAPPPRRVQQPARSTQTRSPARKASVTSGPNADFFELPRGLLDEFKLWSCPGNDWNRELKVPWVYNMKNGWRVVGEIIKARKLLVNLEDTSAEPAQRDTCQEISEKDLDELQYARYISALCEDEGKMNLPESRKVPHNGIKVEVQPKFRIRGDAWHERMPARCLHFLLRVLQL
ncbi:unnamed protein product [Effrenium voratum]|nr:unnamed protein product [Effrenium voratum]